ncbi:MAG: sialidase family protein, partial [Candidatus Latescibacterota bacterium]
MRRALSHLLLLLFTAVTVEAAKPVFENATPVGFSPHDSTTQADFVVGQPINLRVDLDQAATHEYPVVGHFHGVEKSDQISSVDTDGMQLDIAMVDVVPFGVNGNTPAPGFTSSATHPAIHMAWIEQTTTAPGSTVIYTGGSTPLYRVMYSRSFDGGATFGGAVSVTGDITYHLLSTSVANTGTAFSTLDLEVDSGGQPRVVYSFISTADRERKKNIYLSYSTDGGGTWQTPIQVNDTKVSGAAEGRNSAFPRMVVDDRENIFISYVRGSSLGTGADDIMLAKVNRSTSPFTILPIGETGAAGTGGIRLTRNGDRATGPELAVGDGDALHIVYFNDTDDRIEHKRMATDATWADVSTLGWSQDLDGAAVGTFDDEVNAAVEEAAHFYFPSLVVDRNQLPDKVYSLYKFGDATPVEGVYFNSYSDAGAVGVNAPWNTAASIWKTAAPPLFADGTAYNAELDWTITERIAAVVDDRLDNRGDLHIAFSAGFSYVGANATASVGEHDIYYARYNGTSWTLPEKVADDDSDGTGTEDGIATTDSHLSSPVLAQHPDESNLYLVFAGGTDEGFGVNGITNVNHHPYFKVLGQTSTYEDDSNPVGAYQYTLSYTPINAQVATATQADNPIYVHVADAGNGTGLGAQADTSDGFLAGDWETVGTSLADDDKFYEGWINEDTSSLNEWGDDDDKIGLLVKLNVLGSDSATNLQAVTNSTASAAGTGLGARTVTVGTSPFGSFVGAGTYFQLGADINIVASNTAPTVSVAQPDGVGDQANTSFSISYSIEDGDDNLGGNLKLALYAYPTNGLKTVRDIRIFGTLIADENDVSTVNSSGTNDLTEGAGQTYTWDDPPAALKSSLFASILRVPSGTYYVYAVADDQKNPPVYAVSSGPLTLVHSPIIQQVDPIVADTVDTGVRTGLKASPYDLDFSVLDYDSEAHVQLFYAAVSG